MDFVINTILSFGKERVHMLMENEETFIKEAVRIEMAKLGHATSNMDYWIGGPDAKGRDKTIILPDAESSPISVNTISPTEPFEMQPLRRSPPSVEFVSGNFVGDISPTEPFPPAPITPITVMTPTSPASPACPAALSGAGHSQGGGVGEDSPDEISRKLMEIIAGLSNRLNLQGAQAAHLNEHLKLLEAARMEGVWQRQELEQRIAVASEQYNQMAGNLATANGQVDTLAKARGAAEQQQTYFQTQAEHYKLIAQQYKEEGDRLVGTHQGQLNNIASEKMELERKLQMALQELEKAKFVHANQLHQQAQGHLKVKGDFQILIEQFENKVKETSLEVVKLIEEGTKKDKVISDQTESAKTTKRELEGVQRLKEKIESLIKERDRVIATMGGGDQDFACLYHEVVIQLDAEKTRFDQFQELAK